MLYKYKLHKIAGTALKQLRLVPGLALALITATCTVQAAEPAQPDLVVLTEASFPPYEFYDNLTFARVQKAVNGFTLRFDTAIRSLI